MSSKRHKTGKLVGSYYHGYDLPHGYDRGIRQHRKASTGRRTSQLAMAAPSGNGPNNGSSSEDRDPWEAQMIPGLGPDVFGFPKTIITKLRYAEYLSLNVSTGALSSNTFSANGIFDPDITGIGHQPLYRDVYAGVYDNYVVIGSEMTATFITDTATRATLVGVCGDDNATFSTTATTRSEQNNSEQLWIGANTGGSIEKTLTVTYSPQKDLGVDAAGDGSFLATGVGANPADQWYFIVYAQQFASVATQAVLVKVMIEYTVKFTKLSSQTQN